MWCACMAPTMLEELCKLIQHWALCYAWAIMEQKKNDVDSKVWVASNFVQLLKQTQLVTSNNVGSCWPNMLFANVKLNSLLSEMCCLCESYAISQSTWCKKNVLQPWTVFVKKIVLKNSRCSHHKSVLTKLLSVFSSMRKC